MNEDKRFIKTAPDINGKFGYRPPKAVVPTKGDGEKPVEKPSGDTPKTEKKG
jgi:hypothetical protein